MTPREATWTTAQISEALSAAAGLIEQDGAIAADQADIDLLNLLINTGITLLSDPAATLDQVMDANYDGGANEVRSWHDWT